MKKADSRSGNLFATISGRKTRICFSCKRGYGYKPLITCDNAYHKEVFDKKLVKCREYKRNHKNEIRSCSRKYYYGIDEGQFDLMRMKQNDKCAICGDSLDGKTKGGRVKVYVDHNHNNNRVRGLLCPWCNFIIGFAEKKESPIDVLKMCIRYLELYNNEDKKLEVMFT